MIVSQFRGKIASINMISVGSSIIL